MHLQARVKQLQMNEGESNNEKDKMRAQTGKQEVARMIVHLKGLATPHIIRVPRRLRMATLRIHGLRRMTVFRSKNH